MEPAGLAVGIVALAGLFNNAVDCFEYVQLGSAFGTDFQVSLLKLDILRLRLSRWGKSVGLDGDLSNAHAIKIATSPPEDVEKAGKVLGQILDLFTKMESKSKKYQSRMGETDGEPTILDLATNLEASGQSLHEKMRAMSIKRQNSTPLRPKVRWALYERKRFRVLLEDVTDLVNGLVECFPASREVQRRLCETEASTIGSGDYVSALKEVIAQQDGDLDQAVIEMLSSKVSI
ncbi:hypothetical protein AG0111_0g1635 [Alternaria gaisen]|uniref:Uncharacterized protein n=1 Tax=Alternaria gaisen TaxID=167740 RepID=A0ACB6G1I0_9PLEO|nr:hypothetical protein AG0111_0g1635 [Alternaria gaisen]